MKNEWQMVANPEECQLCSMCQLICTLKREKVFNPARAYIKVAPDIRPSGELGVSISFTGGCDNCGVCATYCYYGALSRQKLANSPEQSVKSG